MDEILYSACIQPEAVQSADHREYLSKACYHHDHSNFNSVFWRYTAELPLRRIKLYFFPSKFDLCAKYSHILDFLGFCRMETAPTFIKVLLRPALGQSDEPSDLRGSLSPTTRHRCTHVLVYTAPGSHRRSPIQLCTGPGVA